MIHNQLLCRLKLGDKDEAKVEIQFILPNNKPLDELEPPTNKQLEMRDGSPTKIETAPRRDYNTPDVVDVVPNKPTSVPTVDGLRRRGKGFNWL